MTLSEICQNIVEHAGRGGWVAVQTYTWKKRLGRRVVQIAVCDAGIGFRHSLESAPGRVRDDRWDDGAALEAAVIRGVSRFRDPGRGQGLSGVRRYCGRWDGKLSIRSGTARIAIVPEWDDDVPLRKISPPFPALRCRSRFLSARQAKNEPHRPGLRAAADGSANLYSNLVTRPTGAAVRNQIELLMREAQSAPSPSSTSRTCR